MTKYKIIICLILIILVGGWIFKRELTIKDLEKTIIENEQTIALKDNKIKEQLSVINLLETDQINTRTSIEALLIQVDEVKSNCEEFMNKKDELCRISAAGKTTSIDKIINDEKGDKQVVDKETSNNFINLRNNIIRNYQ